MNYVFQAIGHEQTAAIALEAYNQLQVALSALELSNKTGIEAIVIANRWKEAARTVMNEAQFAEYEKAINQPSPTLGKK